MKLIQEIPDRFWSLFRSVNRSAYIEALLKISEGNRRLAVWFVGVFRCDRIAVRVAEVE